MNHVLKLTSVTHHVFCMGPIKTCSSKMKPPQPTSYKRNMTLSDDLRTSLTANQGDGCGQGGLAVIDVANGADVHVRLTHARQCSCVAQMARSFSSRFPTTVDLNLYLRSVVDTYSTHTVVVAKIQKPWHRHGKPLQKLVFDPPYKGVNVQVKNVTRYHFGNAC